MTDEPVKVKLTSERLNTPSRVRNDEESSLSPYVPQGTIKRFKGTGFSSNILKLLKGSSPSVVDKSH